MAPKRNGKGSLLPSLNDAISNIDMENNRLPPLRRTSRTSTHRSRNEIGSSFTGGISRGSTSENSSEARTAQVLRQDFSSVGKVLSTQSRLTCPVCQKTFVRPSDATKHTKTVHGPRQFQCTVCQQSFARKDYKQVCSNFTPNVGIKMQ